MRNEDWMEVQGDVAEKLTERLCKKRGVKVWVVDGDGERFTEKAQDIFGGFYDDVDFIMGETLGHRTQNFTSGFANKKVTPKKRRELIKKLSEYSGFDVSKLVGNLT